MRVGFLFALIFIAVYLVCVHQGDIDMANNTATEELTDVHPNASTAAREVLEFDLVQRTCAMYVAVRSMALETPIAFDRDLADVPVHWNMCPGGTMVACKAAPTANGDTMAVGIPWPY